MITNPTNISYHGPFRSEASDYFQQKISALDRTTIHELNCSNIFESAFNNDARSYIMDSNSINDPVKYYKISIKSEMKSFYTESLSISTCCDMDLCKYDDINMTSGCNQSVAEIGVTFWKSSAPKL